MTRDDSDDLSIEFTSNLEDYAALLRFISWSASRIVLQALIFAGLGLYLILLALVLGLALVLFDAPSGPLAAASDYLRVKAIDDLAPIAPWIGALCLGVFLLNLFFLVPRQCRLLAKRSLSAYPEVRPDDPAMTLRNYLRVGQRGLEGGTRDERIFVAWPLVQKLVERRSCYYLMTSRTTAIILPKAALAGDTGRRLLDSVRRALARLPEARR